MKKQFTFLILILTISVVISGCNKEPLNNKETGNIENNTVINNEAEKEIFETLITNIDIANWQDYKNDNLSISLKYPENWKINLGNNNFLTFKDVNNVVYYEGDETYLIGMQMQEFDNEKKILEFIENWKNIKVKRGGVVKDVILNNTKAIQGDDYLGKVTLIKNDNNLYTLNKGVFSPEYSEIDNIYNGILNSIEFIK